MIIFIANYIKGKYEVKPEEVKKTGVKEEPVKVIEVKENGVKEEKTKAMKDLSSKVDII